MHFYPQTEIQREVLGAEHMTRKLLARDVELMTQPHWRSTVWGQETLVLGSIFALTGSNSFKSLTSINKNTEHLKDTCEGQLRYLLEGGGQEYFSCAVQLSVTSLYLHQNSGLLGSVSQLQEPDFWKQHL